MFFSSFAQNSEYNCLWQDFDGPDEPGRYSYATDFDSNSFPDVLFKVHFWVLLEDHDESDMGSYNYQGTTEYEALTANANLNKAMNEFGIYFKYDGVDVVNDTSLALQINTANPSPNCTSANYPNHSSYSSAFSAIRNNPLIFPEGILNVYIIKQTVCFGGVGYSDLIGVGQQGLEGVNFVHEIGHLLGLGHTRGGNGNNQGDNTCEHVTRDPNDINDPNDPNDTFFNADIRGDRVVDTAAVPDMWPNEAPYNYDENCIYVGTAGDCQGTEYEFTPEDMSNTMGDAYSFNCAAIKLTPGQGVRMRERIADHPVTNALSSLDLSPLYEPYKGQYYSVGPNLPTGEQPLFQPGFDYRFIECDGNYPQPSDYYDTSFYVNNNNAISVFTNDETNYNSITHPNHSAMRIKQVSGTARKCYDNNNRAAIGGTVTKFNDNVINTNITANDKNATEINNTNLIQTLETGLYKIDKNYEDGSTEEVIIFKGNN